MTAPIMPKSTAVWLLENTSLTFDQIALFCGLHPLEVEAIENAEVGVGIVGIDPVANGYLTAEEINRCEKNALERLKMREDLESQKTKGAKYTPIARRQDRPNAIAWIIRHYPEVSDTQIVRLVGTTRNTIDAIRKRTHWNIQNIKPQNPVLLNLCSQEDLDRALARHKK